MVEGGGCCVSQIATLEPHARITSKLAMVAWKVDRDDLQALMLMIQKKLSLSLSPRNLLSHDSTPKTLFLIKASTYDLEYSFIPMKESTTCCHSKPSNFNQIEPVSTGTAWTRLV